MTLGGRDTMIGGGMTLCMGWNTWTEVVRLTTTGHHSISVVVTAGRLMVVVIVTVTAPERDKSGVVNGGQSTVVVEPSGKGGNTNVQGGMQATEGLELFQTDGGT